MLKKQYAFLLSIAMLALVLLPTSCTDSNNTIDPSGGFNPDDINKPINKIAFVSDRDGNKEIYVMNSNGANQTRLTNHPLPDIGPAWSPDSSKITFTSCTYGENHSWLQASYGIINADGTNQTRITNNTANDTDPAWAP